ncbi:MAG: hypothetical protein K2X04_04605 [Burkholderiales bacterium]|jgi:hypothetical protein|nr:hypothetical protein [Burkholderiales bacterium]
MKNKCLMIVPLIVVACGVQNNITFSTQTGNCADGTSNAPYCMGVTIQNNSGGQNWITNTSFPVNDLALNLSGPSNVGYPSSQGSNFDPNNCLGSSISPGESCTFYLWLQGESAAIGQKPAVGLTANYSINDTLFGGGSTTASASLTVFELPTLLISTSTGWVESYNVNNGFSSYSIYRGESENVANAYTNDNYYGFLYLAGNNGIYLSGNGNYVLNSTNTSTSIRGASNLLINGQTIYAVPTTGTLATSIYNAGIQQLTFNWQTYASGLSNVATNVSAINGSRIFVGQSNTPSVFVCLNLTGSTTNCIAEGTPVPGASSLNVLAYSNLGTANGGQIALTGVVAGANNGLWVESGTVGTATNLWLPVYLSATQPVANSIRKITADSSLNLYIVDAYNNFYIMKVNGGNSATQMTNWTLPSGTLVAAMVYDNTGQTLYLTTPSGMIYGCSNLAGGGSCTLVGQAALTSGVNGLSIVTSLSSW